MPWSFATREPVTWVQDDRLERLYASGDGAASCPPNDGYASTEILCGLSLTSIVCATPTPCPEILNAIVLPSFGVTQKPRETRSGEVEPLNRCERTAKSGFMLATIYFPNEPKNRFLCDSFNLAPQPGDIYYATACSIVLHRFSSNGVIKLNNAPSTSNTSFSTIDNLARRSYQAFLPRLTFHSVSSRVSGILKCIHRSRGRAEIESVEWGNTSMLRRESTKFRHVLNLEYYQLPVGAQLRFRLILEIERIALKPPAP